MVSTKKETIIDSRPNIFIISAKKESHFFGYEHYRITLSDDIMTLSEVMAQERFDLNDFTSFYLEFPNCIDVIKIIRMLI